MINVVAAIIKNKEGKILIARKKKGKSLEGYWEFPGGKIEAGETQEESLVREIKEEMHVEIKVIKYFDENIHNYEKKTVRLIAFIAEIERGNITLVDHDMFKWVELEELKDFPFAPADVPFVEKLLIRDNLL